MGLWWETGFGLGDSLWLRVYSPASAICNEIGMRNVWADDKSVQKNIKNKLIFQ